MKEIISSLVGIKKQMTTPLRAVILDNDETTGSYLIVFGIMLTLKHFGIKDNPRIAEILIRLAKWMNVHHCFRPGLVQLLSTLVSLRRHKKIDAIIMYTNQKDDSKSKLINEDRQLIDSIPESIAFMMMSMIGEPIFDHILARPEPPGPIINGTWPKSFNRVLKLYPDKPKDIRDIVFVDDLAHPAFVLADGIPRCNIEDTSWYPVSPHYRILSQENILDCLTYVFGDLNSIEKMIAPISAYVLMNQPTVKNSVMNASVFLNLTFDLRKKYGWAPKYSHLNQFVPIHPESYRLQDAKTEG